MPNSRYYMARMFHEGSGGKRARRQFFRALSVRHARSVFHRRVRADRTIVEGILTSRRGKKILETYSTLW